jgi:hypothetical protein
MDARGRQSGQATVEWVGLLLTVGLALGALAGGVRGAVRADSGAAGGHGGAAGLGEALASHITCAARDLCGAGVGAPAAGRGPPAAGPPLPPASRRTLPRIPRGRSRAGAGSRLGNAAERAGRLAEGAWIACFGYRTLRYDLEHPRTPREMRPLDATLEIVSDCVNPWELLFGR